MAAPSAAGQLETYGSYELLSRTTSDASDIKLEKWRSRRTGLTLAHVNIESPLVRGYFVLRTEIFDDSGRPHTLEHLVFLGSEQYPFKGVLDNLANRAFAAGTNAWTDTDHTAYTITTAGKDGFLRLLPIYLDHILYPTMTDAGFVTEVHHINEEAEDAGVVYAEMQGREQTSGDIMGLELQRTFFPKDSAYRSETGGLMQALRVLTAEKIREYHRSYYVPHNLNLVITGKMDTKTILDVLEKDVEPRLLKHGQIGSPAGWKRPFLETPSLKKPEWSTSVVRTVEFPEQDESQGEVTMAFVGPDYREMRTRKALELLSQYLGDSPVSPLMKAFVEISSPLCSYIYYDETIVSSFSSIKLYIGGVPTGELEAMPAKVREVLKTVRDQGIDMTRMATIINRDKLKFLNLLESDGSDYYATNLINDFLYGDEQGKDLPALMADLQRYEDLAGWSAQQWADLLNRYVINNPSIDVIGKPSASLPAQLESEEKERVTNQRKALGPDGIARCVKLLEDSKAEHEKPIPSEMLTQFAVPPLSTISWIPVQSAWNEHSKPMVTTKSNELQRHVASDPTELPFFVEFDHIKSSFVTVSAFLSTSEVPEHLLPYLSVYMTAFFSLPVARNGTTLGHEDVVQQLERLTVSYERGTGLGDWYGGLLNIKLKVELGRYTDAIGWLKDLIYSSQFSKERLEVSIAKVQQALPEMRRDGSTILNAVSADILFSTANAGRASAVTTQFEQIPRLAQRLREEPDAVIEEFNRLRESLTRPSGLRFAVSGNVLGVPKPRAPFRVFDISESALSPPPMSADTLSHLGKHPHSKAVVVKLPTIESTYANHTAKCVKGWSHPDSAALRVACEVLQGTESYLWRYIRGAGLAYGANLGVDFEAGLITFDIYKAPDSYRAYEEARKVVDGLLDGTIPFETTSLDAAKSSLVYAAARQVSTPGRAASISFLNQALRGVSQTHGQDLLEDMQTVTVDDVKRILKSYILPIFDPKTSVAVIVSSPAKASEIGADFTKAGFKVEEREITHDEDEDDDMLDGDGESDSGSESQRSQS